MNSASLSIRRTFRLAQSLITSISSFPVKVLTVAVITTLLFSTVLCLQLWHSYNDLKTTQTFYLRLQELSGIIIHYDEILTMSARMGAATGSLEWEERYREYEPQLEAAIKETIELSPEIFMSEAAADTDTSNIKLVAMENRAFDLIRQGQRKAAMALLSSKEYERHKVIYREGMGKINATIQERVNGVLHHQRRQAFLIATFAVVTLPMLLLAWLGIVHLVGIYVADRKETEEALKKAHNELEKKVEDRTAEIKFANKQLQQEITGRSRTEEVLRKTKDFLDNIVESSLDCVVVSDNEGHITRVNKSFLTLFGYKEEEVMGEIMGKFSPHREGVYESSTGEFVEIDRKFLNETITMVSRFLRGGELSNWETYLVCKNKKVIPVDINIVLLHDKEGDRIGAVGILRNITERRKAEKVIKEARDFLENVFNTSVDGILVTDPKGYITMVNEATTKMFGYSKEELIGKHAGELPPQGKEYEKKGIEFVSRLREENVVKGFEFAWLRKGGDLATFETNSTFLKDNKGNIAGALASLRDVTERKHAEQKIVEYQNQLRSLASQLISSEDKNRQNFATFLHDQIGQTLFVLKIRLEMLQKSKSIKENKKSLKDIFAMIDQLIGHTRSLTSELSPPVLHQLGLSAGLEWLAEQTHEREGIIVQFEDDKQSMSLSNDISILLFRAVRELLINISKHAKAQNVKVSLRSDKTSVQIYIEDDGIGFNASETISSLSKSNSFGLFSIKERLNYFGGHLEIKSTPGHGTRITLVAPLNGKKEG